MSREHDNLGAIFVVLALTALVVTLFAGMVPGVGSARAEQNMPPADVVCEEAPVSARRVPVPANARVVSAGPGAGRPWACFVVGRTP